MKAEVLYSEERCDLVGCAADATHKRQPLVRKWLRAGLDSVRVSDGECIAAELAVRQRAVREGCGIENTIYLAG